jgi:hypothetical protein
LHALQAEKALLDEKVLGFEQEATLLNAALKVYSK